MQMVALVSVRGHLFQANIVDLCSGSKQGAQKSYNIIIFFSVKLIVREAGPTLRTASAVRVLREQQALALVHSGPIFSLGSSYSSLNKVFVIKQHSFMTSFST